MGKHNKEKLNYSVCQTLRTRWGLTQAKLAAAAGVVQADISEMESYTPCGRMDKYLRVSKFFGVSVDAVLKNDFRYLAGKHLEFPVPEYCEVTNTPEKKMGRMGEELAYRIEWERVSCRFPGLEELILPYYKMKCPSPGYDILSFDNKGKPMYIEVKTSRPGTVGFRFTNHELRTAREYHAKGLNYVVRNITDWGTEEQRIIDLPYEDILGEHMIKAQYYWCAPKPRKPDTVSGLAYYRRLRGLKQLEFIELMGITQTECSLYENGVRKPGVEFYLKASEVLDASVEELLREYELSAAEVRGECGDGN